MLSPGQQVGNYVVEGVLGGGGMAQLYRVRHAVLGTRHALKVLDTNLRARPDVRSRFLSEGMIAAQLQHPNVVRVTDTVSTPEVAGLVMELIDGPNLEEYLRGQGRMLSASEVRELFVPVLDAVGEAHKRGIIHRDIKPANILLDRSTGKLLPKVTDFGIAKVTEAGDEPRQKNRTAADARMGTLSYMSPEQIQASRDVTARSDIFSLGATLYELATSSVAFDGVSEYDVMHKIVEGRHAPISMDSRIDPAIVSCIQRALEPKPEQRFASCEEFKRALVGNALAVNAHMPAASNAWGAAPAGGALARRLPTQVTPNISPDGRLLPAPMQLIDTSLQVAPPVTLGHAVGALAVNVFAPGIGTLMVGRLRAGIGQLLLVLFGLPLCMLVIGFPMMLAGWIWGLVTTGQLVKAAIDAQEQQRR